MNANENPRPRTDQPDGISSVRFLGMAGLLVAIYFYGRLLGVPSQTHPLVLLVVLPAGWLLGVASARLGWWRPAHSRRARPTVAAARSVVIALMGGGLLLAQVVPVAAIEWLVLGAAALTVGAAGHAWIRERQQRQGQT